MRAAGTPPASCSMRSASEDWSALDPGGQDCFFTDVAVDEDVVGSGSSSVTASRRPRAVAASSSKTSEALVGIGPRGAGGEGSGHEGAHGLSAADRLFRRCLWNPRRMNGRS